MVTAQDRTRWEQGGYAILPGFFGPDEVGAVEDLVEAVWRDRPRSVVVDGLTTGRRVRLSDVPAEDRHRQSYKLNDLYLDHEPVRNLGLNRRLVPVLRGLLGGTPVLVNSLTFERGSQQGGHIDSLYMTPRAPGRLVATWVALEDCHADAGRLFYYPGSHAIPLYRFSDGGHHYVPAEMPKWHAYVEGQLRERGLRREEFAARRGDVFVWHANLVHGGAPIADQRRTRKSLVCHYFDARDFPPSGSVLRRYGEAYWQRRAPVAVDGEERPAGAGGLLRRGVGRITRAVGRLLPRAG
jgi:ectoine hydroxylase-related dioxygenase (phytanoyl-CoA dioxygenase family)